MRRLAAIALCAARPALDRRRGRPLVGGAADRDRRRGGPSGRHRRGLQAAEAADAARARRSARDALARLRGARRLPLFGRRARTRRHDSRARRRPRRLPRPRRLGPPRHGRAPRRGLAPKAGAGTETVARLLGLRVNHPAGRGCARARPQRRRDAGGGRVLARARCSRSPAGSRTQIRAATEQLVLPVLTGHAAATAPPGGLADRLARTSGAARPSRRSSSGTGSGSRAASTAPASSGASSSWSRSRVPPRSRRCSAAAPPTRCRARCRRPSGSRRSRTCSPATSSSRARRGRRRSPRRSTTRASTSAAAGSSTRPETAPPSTPSKGGTATGSPGRAARCAKRASASSRRPPGQKEGRDLGQVVERLVGDPELVQMPRERVAREDPIGGERCAAVRVAVADVRVRCSGDAGALARLAAAGAGRLVAEADPPTVRAAPRRRFASTSSSIPSRRSTGSISSWKPAETITGRSSASSASPGRTSTFASTQSTTSASGASTAANSAAISSCSVRSTPTRGSSSARIAGSPKAWITCTSESSTVTVPSQSTKRRKR